MVGTPVDVPVPRKVSFMFGVPSCSVQRRPIRAPNPELLLAQNIARGEFLRRLLLQPFLGCADKLDILHSQVGK